jgi:hypothetical protein
MPPRRAGVFGQTAASQLAIWCCRQAIVVFQHDSVFVSKLALHTAWIIKMHEAVVDYFGRQPLLAIDCSCRTFLHETMGNQCPSRITWREEAVQISRMCHDSNIRKDMGSTFMLPEMLDEYTCASRTVPTFQPKLNNENDCPFRKAPAFPPKLKINVLSEKFPPFKRSLKVSNCLIWTA